ncbi:MAG: SRPBCC family protein [Saprospiraceae bacterium]|nr:SRPBCC family protein [Saprospiraceae bacterium]
MQNIETKIIINAAVEEVWKALTNFEAYSEWNPFIHSEGRAVEGTRLKNTILLDGQKPQVFTPVLLEVKENNVLRWEGNLFLKVYWMESITSN